MLIWISDLRGPDLPIQDQSQRLPPEEIELEDWQVQTAAESLLESFRTAQSPKGRKRIREQAKDNLRIWKEFNTRLVRDPSLRAGGSESFLSPGAVRMLIQLKQQNKTSPGLKAGTV